VTAMAALTAGMNRSGTADLGPGGPPAVRTTGPGGGDRSAAVSSGTRAVRSWPLLVLAAPAAAEVFSGWVGIAQRTGFGMVAPLPGIWPSLHLNTAITLPVGVEAYAAYALRAWLSSGSAVSERTRRFAKRSAIFSFLLGMAGQVIYHLLAQAEVARAPWAVTTVVSCLPVLVLAMGTTLAHMLRADAVAERPSSGPEDQITLRSSTRSGGDRDGPHADQDRGARGRPRSSPSARSRVAAPGAGTATGPQAGQVEQARLVARRLAAAGRPVSRRALRSGGIRGSNAALNALARTVGAEAAGPPVQAGASAT
jgi:hypothetical protein